MRLKRIYISIVIVAAGLAVQAVLALPAAAATYETHGIATSTNLLFGSSASSITNFHYNLSYLPATSSVTIQFSNDGSTWYSAANVSGGSTTLSLSPTGGTDLSLSALGWSGTAFYYKMTINSTSDQSATPTIDDIRLDYTPTSGYENVFVFDNYGNVGIGTTSPSGKLDIHGAGTTTGINTQWSDLTGAAKVTILDNGNMGIGTTAPTGILDIAGGVKIGAGYAGIGTTAPANGLLVQGSVGIGTTLPSQLFQVNNSGSTAFVVTSGGNVGIGYTSPGAKLVINSNTATPAVVDTATVLQIVGGDAANSRIENNAFGGYAAFLGRRADGTSASPTAVQANEIISRLDARGYGATGYSSAPRAMIDLIAGENWTDAAQGGYLSFSTTLNGGTATSEKMRIDNAGNLGIGTTNPTQILYLTSSATTGTNIDISNSSTGGINWLAASNGSGATYGPAGSLTFRDATNNVSAMTILKSSGNVGIGTTAPGYKLAVYTGTATGYVVADGSWSNASDARLKKNINPMNSSLEKVMALDPVTYNFKTEPNSNPAHIGFIAQDVEKIAPELVSTGPDGYMGISYAMFTPLLTKAIQEQQVLIVEQQAKNTQQDTQISDVNLKTSQNVETVQQLQKSVDDNLTVISSNFSAVDTKLAVQNSQMAAVNSQFTALDTKVAGIDVQLADLAAQYSDLSGNLSLSEAEKVDLENRLSAAENSLVENQHDLITFEKGTNDTLSSMIDTEDMLTNRVLDHEDRLKALEEKVATMTVATGGDIPANVVTQDASGNVTLSGLFKAKQVEANGVVAGSVTVKNDKTSDAPTMGDGEIVSVKVDADKDGWDDVTKADGKSARVTTGAVSETAKIFVSFEGDPGSRYWVEKITDPATGELTGSFSVNLSEAAKQDVKFSWWIVEEK